MRIFATAFILLSFATNSAVQGQTCDSLTFFLEPEHAKSLSGNFTRDAQIYALKSFVDSRQGLDIDGGYAELDCDAISNQKLLTDLAKLEPHTNQHFRPVVNLMNTYQTATNKSLHEKFPIPVTVTDLEKATQFTKWETFVVTRSSVKKAPRRIFFNEKEFPNVLIAQTLIAKTNKTPDPDDAIDLYDVRETEIMVRREDGSKNWDFFAFDTKGALSTTSEFGKGVVSPAPYTCMACHYDNASRTFAPRLF